MRTLITIVIAALSLNAFGQTEYPYPYNPDGNNDGLISLNDLMDLLALYGLEYNAGVLATDSISAIYYTGEMDYWDCTSSCVGLSGNWKVLDHYLVGSYKDDLLESPNLFIWLDHSSRIDVGRYAERPSNLLKENWSENHNYFEYDVLDCFCQTRTRADIEDINLCEGLEDECGVCNGEGAIYECGCTDIPEGDCDCNGSQLDAIGVCGGDCLEDLDGDGVCDPVLGPCEGQDFVSYHGYDYDIVETADGRCWFAENLKTRSFANGTFLSQAQPNPSQLAENWSMFKGVSGTLAESIAGYLEVLPYFSSYIPFGDESLFLYNFTAVTDSQGLCPNGWYVPSVLDFTTLIDSYGGQYNAGLSLKASELDGCESFVYNPSGLEIDARLELSQNGPSPSNISISRLWTGEAFSQDNQVFPLDAKIFEVGNCGAISSITFKNVPMNSGYSVRCIKD